jgi:hypothetical protein
MGSGSFGGGGGGGAAWGGGGSPVINAPMISFHGGRPKATPGGGKGGGGGGGAGGGGGSGGASGGAATPAQDTVHDALKKQLQSGNPYAARQFCSPLTDTVYRALFELKVIFFVNRDWNPIKKKYGVGPEAGCLSTLARVIVDRASSSDPDKRVRQVIQLVLDDFLVRALRGKLNTYLTGDSADVFAHLDPKIFESTSGYFLGFLLLEMVRKTVERPTAELGDRIGDAAQKVADDVIEAFRRTFYQVKGTLYNDLFKVASENREWFFDKLKGGL